MEQDPEQEQDPEREDSVRTVLSASRGKDEMADSKAMASYILASLLALAASAPGGGPTQVTLAPAGDKAVTALHFGVNCEFFRAALYFGTLPASDPRSKRVEFAAALEASGIRSLRFPGGNAAYYYLPEGADHSMALGHAMRYWEYRKDNEPSVHFVTLGNLSSFCREYAIQIVYELPVLFYFDGQQGRAVIPSKKSERAKNYDRHRISEGAAYAKSIVQRLVGLKAPIAAWELGNEEFAHCAGSDYADVCSAYAKAIREVDPATAIVAVGMGKGWLDAIVPRMREAGGLSLMAGLNAHYPFGNWPGPGSPERRGDPKAFVHGDLKMERWLDVAARSRERLGIPHMPISVTETTAMRHTNWHPHAVVCTHAHALVYAWNWMSLLEHPLCDIAVYHDLSTPFFGMLRFDAGYDENARHFLWLARVKDGRPMKRFPGQYVLSPTCLANRLLARLEGCRVRSVTVASDEPTLRGLAGERADGSVVVVMVNRSAREQAVAIQRVTASKATALTADELGSALPGTFRLSDTSAASPEGRCLVTLPPWSVVAIEGRLLKQ